MRVSDTARAGFIVSRSERERETINQRPERDNLTGRVYQGVLDMLINLIRMVKNFDRRESRPARGRAPVRVVNGSSDEIRRAYFFGAAGGLPPRGLGGPGSAMPSAAQTSFR